MSRGPGHVQQGVVALLAHQRYALSYGQIAQAIYDVGEPTRWQREAVGRACRSLERDGKVIIVPGDLHEQPARYAMIQGEPVFVDAAYNGLTETLQPSDNAPRAKPACVVRLAKAQRPRRAAQSWKSTTNINQRIDVAGRRPEKTFGTPLVVTEEMLEDVPSRSWRIAVTDTNPLD